MMITDMTTAMFRAKILRQVTKRNRFSTLNCGIRRSACLLLVRSLATRERGSVTITLVGSPGMTPSILYNFFCPLLSAGSTINL